MPKPPSKTLPPGEYRIADGAGGRESTITVPAPAEASPLVVVGFQRLRHELLEAHPENNRAFDPSDAEDQELVRSLLEIGQTTPAIVRQLDHDRFQVLAGHRRLGACIHALTLNADRAIAAGLDFLEVKVVQCDDHRALRIVILENLQRRSLHWTQEARAVAALLKDGMAPEDVAAELGKGPQWVRLRAKLAEISDVWKQAAEKQFRHWPVAMLELIARLPEERQVALLKGDRHRWDLERCETTKDLQKYLDEHELRNLSSARWKLDDATVLPKAGACSACPKRSSCQQSLFADTKGDRCLDAACWEAKAEAWILGKVKDFKAEHPKGVVFSGQHYGLPDAVQKVVTQSWRYGKCKKDDKGAIAALNLDSGSISWVKADAAAHSDRGVSMPAPKEKTPKQRLEEFCKRRQRAAIAAVIDTLGGDGAATSAYRYGDLEPAKIARPNRATLVCLALHAGIEEGERGNATETLAGLAETLEWSNDELDETLWDRVREMLVEKLIQVKQYSADADVAEAVLVACANQAAWTAIEKQVQDALPLPKSLAALFEEDGTPRRGVTAAKAKPKPKAKAAKA